MDLAGEERITHAHLSEALQYRPRLQFRVGLTMLLVGKRQVGKWLDKLPLR